MCHVNLIFLYNFIKQLASCCFTAERDYRSEAISTHMLSLPCGKPHFSPAVNSEWRQTCQLFHMRDSRDQLLSSRRPCCPRFLLWLGRRFPKPAENSLWKMTSKKKLKRKRNHRKEVRKLPEGSRIIWLEDLADQRFSKQSTPELWRKHRKFSLCIWTTQPFSYALCWMSLSSGSLGMNPMSLFKRSLNQ